MKRSIIGFYILLAVLAFAYFMAGDSPGAATAPGKAAAKSPAKAPPPAKTAPTSTTPPAVTPTGVPVPAAPTKAIVVPPSGVAPVPLFDKTTKLEPDTILDTPAALITRIADRGRDRHCREWMFKAYEHFLPHYWIDRTNTIEVVDTVAKGGKTVTFNMTSQVPLNGPNLRAFFEGKGTVAQYTNNMMSKQIDPLHYQAVVDTNTNEHRPLKIGDRIEIEFSPFIKPPVDPPGSRTNYYGTALLYVVGTPGFQPWEIHGDFESAKKDRGASLDSFPLPDLARSGGMTTGHESYSDEPKSRFDQMATNMAPTDSQPFVLGRRLAHTDFLTGSHSEPENPIFTEQVGRLGARFAAGSCSDCKGAQPTEIGKPMIKYLVRVGADAKGTPHPKLGATLQPLAAKGLTPEAGVSIASWTTTPGTFADGTPYTLQKPVYKFTGVTPEFYSVLLSISKPYGMGLLGAVDEGVIADIAARNGGRMNLVIDPQDGKVRLGRYGYKAGEITLKQQIARRLNESMGLTTSIYPNPDRGAEQQDLNNSVNRLPDADLENIYRYYSLRAVPPRRNFRDKEVQKGEALFANSGCTQCHVPTLRTSPYHPMAELRNQTIHPYTDLLLHDMGKGLADNMADGGASGSEWRTAMLWGLGLISGGSPVEVYLHDGRARNLNEAILWHGGDAYHARETFRNMSAENRAALLKFLKSL
jgi:CxxC motif-containing protein (DUF1111 family)